MLSVSDCEQESCDAVVQSRSTVAIEGQATRFEVDDDVFVLSAANSCVSSLLSRKATPSVASIYEPRFHDIYLAYKEYIKQDSSVDLADLSGKHLMTLILSNMIPFSNWARSLSIQAFIKVSLFDNDDLRPEVRNGLAYILMYTFGAAKAMAEHDELKRSPKREASIAVDMFGVVERPDTGLGIVNKTSLRIYNDNWQYHAFIKACLAGLIDAGAIVENVHRPNALGKRLRPEADVTCERNAYNLMQATLVGLLQQPNKLKGAQVKILRILESWREKGDRVRYKKFSAVLADILAEEEASSVSKTLRVAQSAQEESRARAVERKKAARASKRKKLREDAKSARSVVIVDNRKVNSVDSLSPTLDSNSSDDSTAGSHHEAEEGLSKVSTPAFLLSHRVASSAVPCLCYERTAELQWRAVSVAVGDVEALSPLRLPKRSSGAHYLVDEVRLQAYLHEVSVGTGTHGIVLTEELRASGVYSLATLLQKSGCVVTQWSSHDFPQMRGFLQSWAVARVPTIKMEASIVTESSTRALVTPAASGDTAEVSRRPSRRRSTSAVPDQPRSESVSASIPSISVDSVVGESSRGHGLIEYWCELTQSVSQQGRQGRGVIVFERSQEVGLVLRANSALQVGEDAWCLAHPSEVSARLLQREDGPRQRDPRDGLLGLLTAVLPQASALSTHQGSVRYCAHNFEQEADAPPLAPPVAVYKQWSGAEASVLPAGGGYFLDFLLQ